MTDQQLAQASDTTMLALTLWREASNQPKDTQVAVAASILNRVRRPSWWGDSILAVIVKKWQYSSLTAPGDPNLVRWPHGYTPDWVLALEVAAGVMDGSLHTPTPGADSYYDVSLPTPPTWATPETFVGQVGRMRFYNQDRDHEVAVTG